MTFFHVLLFIILCIFLSNSAFDVRSTDIFHGFASVMFLENSAQGEAGLPVAWLPRMVDMCKAGRRDIENAVQRFGGYDVVAERMG